MLVLVAILGVAAFLRFYQLSDYMTFLGDEGRDALIIKGILVDHIIPSIGPPSSVGNIYLGPLYYYMMTVSMLIFWLNPVAAVGMVALIGVAAVGLIYYLARSWFGIWEAVAASSLYAVSFVTVMYSRSSWNPNPAPFFALFAIVGLDFVRRSKNFLWLILTGVSLGAALQMHYLSLILLPVFGLFWLYELYLQTKGQEYKNFIFGTIAGLLAFLIVMLPLILFDFRHNFLNYHGLLAIFTQGDSSVGFDLWTSLSRIFPIYIDKLIGRYLAGENNFISLTIGILILIPLGVVLKNRSLLRWPYFILGIWLLIGLLGLSLYKQEIYDHYLGFINPVPFLLLGGLLSLFNRGKLKIGIAIALVLILGYLNLLKDPIFSPPNKQLLRTQEVAKFVIGESENKPFNFALIAARNYDAAYQYYLDLYGYKPKVVPLEITDQLFVVCEDAVCNPVGHPKYEIAGFGWAKIEKTSEVFGVRVYKLIHNPTGKPS